MTSRDEAGATKESRVLSHCAHPNIIKVLLSFQSDALVMLCLEAAEHGCLNTHLKAMKTKTFEPKYVLFYMAELVSAGMF